MLQTRSPHRVLQLGESWETTNQGDYVTDRQRMKCNSKIISSGKDS